MAFEVVKSFPGGTSIGFTEGKFDRWCVQERVFVWTRRPTDAGCFARLLELAQRYGTDKVMADFVAVYDAMGVKPSRGDLLPSDQVLDLITRLSTAYNSAPGDDVRADRLFTTLYLTMIAEENKAKAVLGKRIKRLGVHLVLMEGRTPEEAAAFPTGKKAAELSALCQSYGF